MLNDLNADILFCGQQDFFKTGVKLEKKCDIKQIVFFNGDGSNSYYETGIAGAPPLLKIALKPE